MRPSSTRARLGYELTAFVSCYTTAEATYDNKASNIAALPEVLEIDGVTGEETFVLRVATRSTAHLDDFLNRLARIRGVARTKTTIVLSTPFERGGLALDGDGAALAGAAR